VVARSRVGLDSLLVVVALVLFDVRRPMVLLAYFLATAAAGAALRTLRGAFTTARRRSQPWWDALRGPSAGGMIVHLGSSSWRSRS